MKKKSYILICFLVVSNFCVSQQLFDDFKKSSDEALNNFLHKRNEAFERFTAQQNAEFASFVEQQWQLFDDFRRASTPFLEPKLQNAPVASKTNSSLSFDFDDVIEFIVKSISMPDKQNNAVPQKNLTNITVDFYGENLSFSVNDNLRLSVGGASESDVANYLRNISKYSAETSNLWSDIFVTANKFGLNEWGKYLITKSIAEGLFVNKDDIVAFSFYMLRNMGGYKAKVGRSVVSGNLVLLLAIDNTKEVYNYGFFQFKENDKNVKYYLVYGDDSNKIYTYNLNNQDLNLAQIKLDFDTPLSIGYCDKIRELKINGLNTTINLPFNSKNIAFLDDVPQTVFPIYFVSAMSQESQNMLNEKFGGLNELYSVPKAVEVILNFVQTAFDYKTDDDQFGREKYFYPEEVIAYPYCDCEDRSALFGWLVRRYLNLSVIGLQYPGHLATAVCFGDDITIDDATAYNYGGKKYYVCDPTYINAKVGQEMPQFKNITPKVIKLKKM